MGWPNPPVWYHYEFDDLSGGLFGSNSVVNVSRGTLVRHTATAFDGYPRDVLPSHFSGNKKDTAFVFIHFGSVVTPDYYFDAKNLGYARDFGGSQPFLTFGLGDSDR